MSDSSYLLYFVRNPMSGLIKIGVTTNFTKRMTDLSHANGAWLEVLSVRKRQSVETEASLHGVFARHRTVGEWFSPDPELVDVATMPQKQFAQWLKGNRSRLKTGLAVAQYMSRNTAKEGKVRYALTRDSSRGSSRSLRVKQPVPEQANTPKEPRRIVSAPVGSLPNRGGVMKKRGAVSVESAVECCGAFDRDWCGCLEAAA